MLAAPDQQISLTDPDARSMATSGRSCGIEGYNVQIVAVDTTHHLIITHEGDQRGIRPVATLLPWPRRRRQRWKWRSSMPSPIAGYFSSEEILDAGDAGIAVVTLPKPMTPSNAKAEGRIRQAGLPLRWLGGRRDVYICPAGERLTYRYTKRENGLVLRRYWTNACQSCAIKNSLHHRQGATDHPMGDMGAFSRRCSAGSTTSSEDAPAARDGRASIRHDQGPDGRNPLPDEDVAKGRHRDGVARAGLQSAARREHHRRPAAPDGDEGIVARHTALWLQHSPGWPETESAALPEKKRP